MIKYLPIRIQPQPDDVSCGPTCLHSIYHYYDDPVELDTVIREVKSLKDGGTLAVMLGCHAVARGYKATIYTYNLHIFDPSWFQKNKPVNLIEKLMEQDQAKKDDKISFATRGYIDFLEQKGEIRFGDFKKQIFQDYLSRNIPILTGLSATYLYNSMREYVPDSQANQSTQYDDIRGYPSGHFVVASGYDLKKRQVLIADPYHNNPLTGDPYYHVRINRLMHSILLGIVTYDANLLIIEKP